MAQGVFRFKRKPYILWDKYRGIFIRRTIAYWRIEMKFCLSQLTYVYEIYIDLFSRILIYVLTVWEFFYISMGKIFQVTRFFLELWRHQRNLRCKIWLVIFLSSSYNAPFWKYFIKIQSEVCLKTWKTTILLN